MDEWEPLHRASAGPRRVPGALTELCRCLSAHLRGEPPPVPSDWAAVVATAESYRVTPALWEAVGTEATLPEPLATRLQAQYAANVVALARMSDQVRHALGRPQSGRHGARRSQGCPGRAER